MSYLSFKWNSHHRFSYQIIVPKISAVLRTVAGDMFSKESSGFK